MDDSDIPHLELIKCLGSQLFHLLQSHFLVRFVVEVQGLPSPSIVSNNPLEDHLRTIFGTPPLGEHTLRVDWLRNNGGMLGTRRSTTDWGQERDFIISRQWHIYTGVSLVHRKRNGRP